VHRKLSEEMSSTFVHYDPPKVTEAMSEASTPSWDPITVIVVPPSCGVPVAGSTASTCGRPKYRNAAYEITRYSSISSRTLFEDQLEASIPRHHTSSVETTSIEVHDAPPTDTTGRGSLGSPEASDDPVRSTSSVVDALIAVRP